MIKVTNVKKVYPGGTVAVDSISFHVPEGTITCLIGTSGCGKTTTLKMINRLVEPSEGEILINGRPVQKSDPIELRRSIGYVIQRGGLMPHMTIRRNIALLEEVKGTAPEKRKARAEELMQLVGLPPETYAHRYPAELSGGQQQRVGIARALMADPPVLLMDEPFGALDPITRSHLHQELLTLNRQLKKTIMIVTHDLAEAFKLGNEIILMNKGQVVQKGGRSDFIENPANDFAAEFVSSQMEGYR